MKGVQCYELFGGIALKIRTFSFSFYKRVWSSKSLKKKTKFQFYRSVVLTTLIYGSETWVTYCSHIHLLERFLQRCLCTILNIHWSDFVTNVEVLEKAEITSIEEPAPLGRICFQNEGPSFAKDCRV